METRAQRWGDALWGFTAAILVVVLIMSVISLTGGHIHISIQWR